ncbi:MAG: hypothetical protein ACLUQK_04945 [Clostridium sp.]|uniref:hypothetical protein n=2 Tax=Bacillota TaxID=1239 RepID=UPI001AFAEF2B|nr:hypothetical protein [[Clostridium] innocuum]QSI24341.1 hypothetical protein GKZ87_01890 [Erysipelotrichaceae bacterium 66202529]MCC2832798.1 hypothetical protein [[Clostridium] innocuum]MCR0248279.1 hypothetical protein [[Clostridium] innocuum]MCR0260894.1 hypothetical protein [[Clostridium] innocuum]MCR0392517.1 hypothetical protein [[Clostridium] innocuum]
MNMNSYELKSIGNVEVKEFMLSSNGYNLIGFLGKGTHYNWLSLPQLGISLELSDFSDDFWNTEQLAQSIDDPVLIDLLSCVLHDLEHLFGKSKQDCFDGKNFITAREYTFWLECECESRSRQLLQFENDLFSSKMSQKDLDEDRLNYYVYSREQYGTDAF